LASFIPKSITFFNDKFECKAPYTKIGPLCYEKEDIICAGIGYNTCGIAACSVTNKDCRNAISGMVGGTIIGTLKLTSLILNPAMIAVSLT